MNSRANRRSFLKQGLWCAAAGSAAIFSGCCSTRRHSKELFKISLAEWSYHNAIFSKKMDHLDFPVTARRQHDISAIELVNQFFMDKATDQKYLQEFRRRAEREGVSINLIMCDDEGDLGDVDPAKRRQAVANHHKWADAAKYLGCYCIRVNAETGGVGTFE